MLLEKSLVPSLFATFITILLVGIFSVGFIFWITPPLSNNTPITLTMLWQYVWTDGFINKHYACGINLLCRLAHFQTVIVYPPIAWRFALIGGACFIGALITFFTLLAQTPLRETVRTLRGGKIRYDADARQSLRSRLQRTGNIDATSL